MNSGGSHQPRTAALVRCIRSPRVYERHIVASAVGVNMDASPMLLGCMRPLIEGLYNIAY